MMRDEEPVARAYADHLRERDSAHAHQLAEALAEIGDARRAEALRAFTDRGACTVPDSPSALFASSQVGLLTPEDVALERIWSNGEEMGPDPSGHAR